MSMTRETKIFLCPLLWVHYTGRSEKKIQKQASEEVNWTFQQEKQGKRSKSKPRRRKSGHFSRKKQEKSPKASPGAGNLDISGGRSKYNVQKQAPEEENWTFQPEEASIMSKSKPRRRRIGHFSRKKQEKSPKASPGAGKPDLPAGRSIS